MSNQQQQGRIELPDPLVQDLATLVMRLTRVVKEVRPQNPLVEQATEFLKRHNLNGNILR